MCKYKEKEIREYAIEAMKNLTDSNIYGGDLHNEIFNTDYYIIGTKKAEDWLGSHVFETIRAIMEYEKNTFGKVSTDISEPEKLVNMYAYIIGKEILQDSKTLQNKWNEHLTKDDFEKIKKELKK